MSNRTRGWPPQGSGSSGRAGAGGTGEGEGIDPSAAIRIAEALSGLAHGQQQIVGEVRLGIQARRAQLEAEAARARRSAEFWDWAKVVASSRTFGVCLLIVVLTLAGVVGSKVGLDVEDLARSAAHAYTGCPVGTSTSTRVPPNPQPLTAPLGGKMPAE